MHRVLGAIPTVVLWVLVLLWTIPTLGMLVSSFRPEDRGARRPAGGRCVTDPQFTLGELRGRVLERRAATRRTCGSTSSTRSPSRIPATLIPIAFAAFAAYAFAWMDFQGRNWLFIGVVALLAVPIQMSLVPLLQLFAGGAHLTLFGETFTLFPDLDLAGTTTAVWLTHIGFGLPLAIFLLHNYIVVAARRPVRGGPHRRRRPPARSSGGWCCRCRCRRSRPSPSSSSSGCGTTTWWRSTFLGDGSPTKRR